MGPTYTDGEIRTSDNVSNNLKVLTQQLDDGKRSNAQIHSMLMGMGVSEELAKLAVETYVLPRENAMHFLKNIKNKTDLMDFNLQLIVGLLTDLKNNLKPLKESNSTRINYSTQQSFSVVEGLLSEIHSLGTKLDEYNNASLNEQKEFESRIGVALNSRPEFYFASKSLNVLSNYTDINVIKEYADSVSGILAKNKFTNKISNLVYSLNESDNSAFYANVTDSLTYLLKQDESYIKENAGFILKEHSWIPAVKGIIADSNSHTTKLRNSENVSVEKVFSPIQLNEDGSYIFHLDGLNYKINENVVEIAANSDLNFKYKNLTSVLENYEVNEKSIVLYKPNAALEMIFESNSTLVNGLKVNNGNIAGLKNALITSNFYRLGELHNVDKVLYVIENREDVKALDNVTRLTGVNGLRINVIKLDERNIYLNRINANSRKNELIKVDNYSDAQNLVNEYFVFDISKSLTGLLENEQKVKVNLVFEKEKLEQRLSFLTEKKDDLLKFNEEIKSDEINEALELVNTEIKRHEVQLKAIYETLAIHRERITEVLPYNKKELTAYADGQIRKVYTTVNEDLNTDNIECFYKDFRNDTVKTFIKKEHLV